MRVLASDKTGTLTENKLTLGAVYPYAPYSEEDVIRLGALASDEATEDPCGSGYHECCQGAQAEPVW